MAASSIASWKRAASGTFATSSPSRATTREGSSRHDVIWYSVMPEVYEAGKPTARVRERLASG